MLLPADVYPPPDPHSGVVQRRLSNGIAVNYRVTDNEPRAGLLRLIANGGRIAERPGSGQFGRVVVGTRTLSESGAVGPWAREQVRGRVGSQGAGRRNAWRSFR